MLAAVAFGSVYAGMLAVTVWVRSAALSAAAGASLVVLGLLATHRTTLLDLMGRGVGPRRSSPGSPRWCHRWASWPTPRPRSPRAGRWRPGGLLRLLAGTVAFAAALLAVAVWRFERRDF